MTGSATAARERQNASSASQPLRIESGDAVMLYDASVAGNFTADWFSPEHWRVEDALRGAARGRGNTWFFATADRAGATREYALRHYRRGGLVARVLGDRYLYRGESATRPMREFALTRELAQLGLPVPNVIAARVQRAGIFYRGDLITERIPGARSLAESLKSDKTIDWHAIGVMLARFHAAGLDHADLNAHNILFDETGRCVLIDFDRCRRRAPGVWREKTWREANLARLQRSIAKVTGVAQMPDGWQRLLEGYRA